MAVLRDFCCLAHGNFESMEENPECPMGCDTVERIFLQAPGLVSARTGNIDRTLESLAKSHKLTDIGPAAMRRKALAAEQSEAKFREFCEKRYGGYQWGATPQGGNLNVQTGKVTGSGPGAIGAVQAAGASEPMSIQDNKAMLEAMKKPVLVRRDHENLQVDVSKAA